MTIEQIEARLHELGGGPELVAWIDSQGFDAELICFAARCLAGAAGDRAGEHQQQGPFLHGHLSSWVGGQGSPHEIGAR